ncbi:kelch-like protein 28 [Bactrocera neohumeralis]|uniref:kelch-like protein 28 n=1 Tax=Bactrocera neohumeralis TaxID=98809 RepID=UPI0021650491|nr:kelch-like protein 28 [Bactrocera neohumeralis]
MASSSTQTLALQTDSSKQNRFMEKLMAKIVRLYGEKSLIDVTFKVSNPTAHVPAHRLILAAASPYFENRFKGNKGNNPIIEINDVDSDIFKHLITFCYTGQALITVNNVGAMLKAAILLQLDDALGSCVDFLMANIDEYTIQGAYTLEDETKCELLKQKIVEYEIKNFMRKYPSETMQHFLKYMRFTEPRGNYGEKTLLAVCSEINPKVLQYNKAENMWLKYARIKFDYHQFRTILKDDNLLFIGGSKDYAAVDIVRSWNIRNKTWQDLPVMKQPRRSHCVVELDSKIYAIGGRSLLHNKVTSTVERYTTSDGWEYVNDMNNERYDASAVTLNGDIYIIGGSISSDRNTLKSVECYNPDSNTWTSCADMIKPRSLHIAAVHNGHIYVLSNSGVERYDPQQDTWSQICSLNVGHGYKACVSLDNKLWVIGVDGVSVYDEENDRWEQKCASPGTDVISCFVVPVALLTSNE